MKLNKFRYVMILIFAILLIIEFCILDYSNFWHWKNFIRFPAPILMIIAMVIGIHQTNKRAVNKNN